MIIRGDSIISFLEGETEDYKGRTFDSMLEMSDEQLEHSHDIIQWLYPLHEESKHTHTYPIVDEDVVNKGIESYEVGWNLTKATKRFEKFYGIGEFDDEGIHRRWCNDRDHNLLRITRIIRCLRLFDMEDSAKDFYDKVTEVANRRGISPITKMYWHKAMNDDVWKSLQ